MFAFSISLLVIKVKTIFLMNTPFLLTDVGQRLQIIFCWLDWWKFYIFSDESQNLHKQTYTKYFAKIGTCVHLSKGFPSKVQLDVQNFINKRKLGFKRQIVSDQLQIYELNHRQLKRKFDLKETNIRWQKFLLKLSSTVIF